MLWAMLVGGAQAADGLVWHWEEPRRYALHAQIDLPEGLRILAVRNLEAQVLRVDVDLYTTCGVAQALGASAWELSCAIDEISLGALPARDGVDVVGAILGEMDERLSSASVIMELTADGRLRSLDLRDLSKDDDREKQIYETSRELLLRTFAAFDLQLPKKGDDHGKGSWKQARVRGLEPISWNGVQGSAKATHTLTGVDGSVATITTHASGAVGNNDQVQVGDTSRPANLFDSELEGTASFDLKSGTLLERSYATVGKPTPSSLLAATSSGVIYAQAVTLHLASADEQLEPLRPSHVLLPER